MNKAIIYRCIKWILAIVLIRYVSIELIDYGQKLYYACQGSQWYPARIERITGVRMPHFEVLYRYESRLYIEHDSIAFHVIPSSYIFDEIDKRIAAGDTCWRRSGDLYSFHLWWDKESKPPKGEKYYTGDFQVKLMKGRRIWNIRYWDLERLDKENHIDEKNN